MIDHVMNKDPHIFDRPPPPHAFALRHWRGQKSYKSRRRAVATLPLLGAGGVQQYAAVAGVSRIVSKHSLGRRLTIELL